MEIRKNYFSLDFWIRANGYVLLVFLFDFCVLSTEREEITYSKEIRVEILRIHSVFPLPSLQPVGQGSPSPSSAQPPQKSPIKHPT